MTLYVKSWDNRCSHEGVVECWSNGVMIRQATSNTPVLQHSINIVISNNIFEPLVDIVFRSISDEQP